MHGGRGARAAGILTQKEREREAYVSAVQPAGTLHLGAMLLSLYKVISSSSSGITQHWMCI